MHVFDENRFLVMARDAGKGNGQPDSLSVYRQVHPSLEFWLTLVGYN